MRIPARTTALNHTTEKFHTKFVSIAVFRAEYYTIQIFNIIIR